jgi:hypothetical protein
MAGGMEEMWKIESQYTKYLLAKDAYTSAKIVFIC